MKKTVSLLLAAIMLFSASFSAPAGAAGPDGEPTGETEPDGEIHSCNSLLDALDYIRTQLKAREPEFYFVYTETDAIRENDILKYASSSADEGDYLRFSLASLDVFDSGETVGVAASYRSTVEQEQAVTDAVTQIVRDNGLNSGTAYRKAVGIYGWLCDHVAYAGDDAGDEAHTAYGALVNGSAVCQGYALAFYRLARAVSLDCRIVAGTLKENGEEKPHAWNAVKIGSSWYYADATNGAAAQDRYAAFMTTPAYGDFELIPAYDEDPRTTDDFLTAEEVAEYTYDADISGSCGTGVAWTLSPSSGLLRITGSGAMDAFKQNDLRWRAYPEILTDVYAEESVTAVCADCFTGCDPVIHCVAGCAMADYAAENGLTCHTLTATEEVPATCVVPGRTAGLKCEACDEFYAGCDVITVGDHSDADEDGACDVCGERLDYEAGGVCGDAVHWYYFSTGELVLKGTGGTYDFTTSGSKTAPWKSAYAGKIKQITVLPGVTRIGNCAFYNCAKTLAATLPEGLTEIGARVFYGASLLEEADLPETLTSIGAYAFYNCKKLTSAILPDGITEIPENTYNGCTVLATVRIPDSVTAIGNNAFNLCKGLNISALPSRLTTLGYKAFGSTAITEILIPASLTKVFCTSGDHYGPFAGSSLETVRFAAGVSAVPGGLCARATNLKNVVFTEPATVTKIGDNAFFMCSGLTSIQLPDPVTEIGLKAFYNTAITEILIPASLTKASCTSGDYYGPFAGSPLETIRFAAGVSAVPGGLCAGATDLKNVVFTEPDAVKKIGAAAFARCTGLTTVDLPDSVTEIGNYAFAYCPDFTITELPSQLTSLGYRAFLDTAITEILIPASLTKASCTSGNYYGPFAGSPLETIRFAAGVSAVPGGLCARATNLKNVVFTEPATVTKIGDNAFFMCSGLTSIQLPDSVTEIGLKAFYNTAITEILIPASLTKTRTSNDCGPFAGTPLETVRFAAGVSAVPDGLCAGATDLKNVVFTEPDDVRKIGSAAFIYCTGLTTVDLPDSVTEIGNWAFAHCPDFTITKLPSQLASLGYKAFLDTAITEILIPASLTKASCTSGDYYGPFAGSPLETIRFAAGITAVPDGLCARAANLKNVVFTEPAAVTSIGGYAFYLCVGLQQILLPESVAVLGNNTFGGCSALSTVLFPAVETTIAATSFKNCPDNLVIHCPESSDTEAFAGDHDIECHTDYEINEISLQYCSGEAQVAVAAYCRECGRILTKDGLFDAQGHTVVTDPGVPATCTETGLTAGTHCGVCQTVLQAQETIPAKGHTPVDTAAMEPTCTANGKTAGVKCGVCGEVLVEPEVIPKTGHTVAVDPAVAPTCTQPGLTEGSHCSVCGRTLEKQQTIPAAGHRDTLEEGERADGVCDVCGEQLEENFFQRIIHRIGSLFEGLSRFIKNLFKKKKK